MDRAAILEKVIEVVQDTLDVEEGTTLGDATSFEDEDLMLPLVSMYAASGRARMPRRAVR